MAWRTEKTKNGQDLVWDGVEQGIAPSPTKGTANIQNANIATELGEAMVSYGRIKQNQEAISGGTLTASVSDGATLLAGPAALQAGQWITISASTIPALTGNVDYLVVAGGGGGGGANSGSAAGGGGAGGMLTGTTAVAVQSYAITVGAGGAGGDGATSVRGSTGSNSVFTGIATATGGGGGGSGGGSTSPGLAGGSGGGGGSDGTVTGGLGTVGQGKDGGAGRTAATKAGGGGGGATAVGAAAASGVGGAGGAGTASSISGASVTYAGGGGGGSVGGAGTAGAGGAGGGGAGGAEVDGTIGTVTLGGGGGGGGGSAPSNGALGGSGVVIISYTTNSISAIGGAITTSGGNTIHTFTSNGTFTVLSIATGTYFVSYKDSSNKVKLSSLYDPYGLHPILHGTSGTATFSTLTTVASPIAKATEKYSDSTTTQYRYYMLDSNSYIWVYDTAVYTSTLAANGVGIKWMLPDPTAYGAGTFTGMNVLNGWLFALTKAQIRGKPTSDLGLAFTALTNGGLINPFATHTNFAFVGHQGKMYYCDGNYIGMLFPTTSFETGQANIQSFASYTASTTTGTVTALLSGSIPYTANSAGATVRIPAVFFTDQYGSQPVNLVPLTVYYIQATAGLATFEVYTASSGGSAINIQTGAGGNQFFNTFYPIGTHSGIGGDHTLVEFSPQRLNLPSFEVAQSMVEIGNTVIVGGITNTLYPWNQVDAIPSDFIFLPESNVKTMINVNNMGYVFAGNKGNIYITNTSVASLVTKVPDYCAGVPGTPLTYIEPYFTWGDAMYVRGRVYFSILDQLSTKTGNCGGIWSFIPTQNFYVGQDIGLALRQENRSSYGSYNGVATVLLPNEQQNAVSPQYWSGWQNSYSVAASTFGIDATDTVPATLAVIETDLLNSGTYLDKTTFGQLEYKLSTPLASGDSVQLYYRLNATSAWATCGTTIFDVSEPISGYYEINFQKTQWTQIRAELTSNGTTSSSFVRFKEIRLR